MDNGNKDKRADQGEMDYSIYYNNNAVKCTGSWVLLNTFTLPNQPNVQTSHSTAEPNASIFIPFSTLNGSTFHVLGVTPTGKGDIIANYSVDGGHPNTRSVPTATEAAPEFFQPLFTSPLIEEGPHNLSIKVLETGKGRNYTFNMVQIFSDDGKEVGKGNQTESGSDQGGTSSTVIVGGMLGTVILLLLGLFTAYYLLIRRRAHLKASGNTMEQHSNAPDTSRTVPGSLLSEQSVPVIDPYILPEPDPGREPTFAPISRAVSMGTVSTSSPAYETVDGRSENSIRARVEPSEARASYATSRELPLYIRETGNPFEAAA